MIVAIDGPAGAGKSTVAKLLAQKLGFVYVDTGAMYRALTLKALENNIALHDVSGLAAIARASSIDLINTSSGSLKVLLDGREVTDLIREPRITRVVSDIAKIKEVREVLMELQRKLGGNKDVVVDGRDIGTVVFPRAERKFFLDADFKERIKRRYKELKAAGSLVSAKDVEGDLANRDTIDSTRECAPLKKADDAIYIDTTALSIEQVVDTLFKKVKNG